MQARLSSGVVPLTKEAEAALPAADPVWLKANSDLWDSQKRVRELEDENMKLLLEVLALREKLAMTEPMEL